MEIPQDLFICLELPCLLMFKIIFFEVVLWFYFPFQGPQTVYAWPNISIIECLWDAQRHFTRDWIKQDVNT